MVDEDRMPPPEKVSRQVGRRLANWTALIVSLGVLGAWCFFGYYELEPGEHAVILRMGRYARTVTTAGPRLHLPPPLESHEIVRVAESQREEFGKAQVEPETAAERLEAGIQTKANNVVLVQFSVQYRIKDAFFSRYRVASPREVVRDAAQAAIREVIGRTEVDGVLYGQKALVSSQTRQVLQEMLDGYEAGIAIDEVNLEDVQAPDAVKEAFSDVVSADQDRETRINEAQGYANEVLPEARGQASEVREAAQGYRDAKIAQATGEAQRFSALHAEYKKAPAVTRKRLYLETMEEILPDVQKVIIQPGTQVLPYLPIGPTGKAGCAMRRLLSLLVVGLAIVATLLLAGTRNLGPVLITQEGEQKMVLRLGSVAAVRTEPGLWWRIPLLDDVLVFEKRLLYFNADPISIQTEDAQPLNVDYYVLWRIADPRVFYESFPGGINIERAVDQIRRVVGADVQELIGQHSLDEVITTERASIMSEMTAQANEALGRYGIAAEDVRINRTELPNETLENVYARMRTERQRLARKYRAEGDEQGRRVRAEADRDARVIVAEATRDSEILRGEGDAEAARIYAEAYTADPEFYDFVRSLEAYRKTIGSNTTLVLPPDSEFFRLFGDADAR